MEEVKYFSLENLEIDGYVCSVYDGDTITAVFPFPETSIKYKWRCRLDGIDTPEIRTKDKLEKCKGIEVRDILRSKILNKTVHLKCKNMDKYGRVLVTIYFNGECINDWLITNKYAKKYDGGCKSVWNFSKNINVDSK